MNTQTSLHINKQAETERKQVNKDRLENAKNKFRNVHKMAEEI